MAVIWKTKRWLWWLAGLAGLLLLLAPAGARTGEKEDNWGSGALCAKCRGMAFTADIGKCQDCGRGTSSGGLRLCQACARKAGKCQACGAALGLAAPPEARAANKKAVAEGNTRFALALYAKLAAEEANGGKNLFLSPYSISSALAMTYAGARGDTAKEMREALCFPMEGDDLHAAFATLCEGLMTGGDDGSYEVRIANRLWGQKDYKFLDDFLALNGKHYGAGLAALDFIKDAEGARKTINAWVEKETKEKIKDLIPPKVLTNDTRLVLTNAIYFKGHWARQFKKEATKEEDFFTAPGKAVKATLMRQTAGFPYAETDDLQLVELPYEGEKLSMVVLLPRKPDGLAAVEKALDARKLAGWLGRLEKQEVTVGLPRFKVTSAFRLDETLKALGMKDAFAAKADFSGMTGTKDLYISAALHKAFVDVNEEGTEAAAATAVVMRWKNGGGHPVFLADHPFLFLIRDRSTGSVLFFGRVADPTKAD